MFAMPPIGEKNLLTADIVAYRKAYYATHKQSLLERQEQHRRARGLKPRISLKHLTDDEKRVRRVEYARELRRSRGSLPRPPLLTPGERLERKKAETRLYNESRKQRRLVDPGTIERKAQREADRLARQHQRAADKAAAVEKRRERLPYRPDPEKERLRRARWRAANPDKYREGKRQRKNAHKHRRRAQTKGANGRFTATCVKDILTQQRHKCAYCRTSIKKARHLDHIVPLALGGTNDRQNIQGLCPDCNISKGAMDPIAFARQEFGLLL
jgi:5-methylcytosine-specific restriction endonuclease McrA